MSNDTHLLNKRALISHIGKIVLYPFQEKIPGILATGGNCSRKIWFRENSQRLKRPDNKFPDSTVFERFSEFNSEPDSFEPLTFDKSDIEVYPNFRILDGELVLEQLVSSAMEVDSFHRWHLVPSKLFGLSYSWYVAWHCYYLFKFPKPRYFRWLFSSPSMGFREKIVSLHDYPYVFFNDEKVSLSDHFNYIDLYVKNSRLGYSKNLPKRDYKIIYSQEETKFLVRNTRINPCFSPFPKNKNLPFFLRKDSPSDLFSILTSAESSVHQHGSSECWTCPFQTNCYYTSRIPTYSEPFPWSKDRDPKDRTQM